MTSRRRWACSAARTASSRSSSAVAERLEVRASGPSTGRGRGSTRPGTSWSCGATAPATAANPRASALRRIAPRRRVLPMPAWPASSRNCPCPATTSSRRRSVRSSRSSRPIRSGQRTARGGRSMTRSVGQRSRPVIGHSTDAARASPVGRSPDDGAAVGHRGWDPTATVRTGRSSRRSRCRSSWTSTPGSSG